MHSQFRIAVASCSLPYPHSHLVTHARLASSSTSSRFPFPSHRNPTPLQIFHLLPGASQADIKARCTSFRPCTPSPADTCTTDYELARTFHPDSPAAQALPATVRHARFHAVTRAYDILRGKPHSLAADDDGAELARRRRQRQVYRQRAAADFAEAAGVGGADEAWKDQVIIVFGLAVRALSSSLCFMRPSMHRLSCRPSWWASYLHCCRCTRFPTRDIVLHRRTWHRLEQMHGHLETNDAQLFMRA
jgi:hypothetical protein